MTERLEEWLINFRKGKQEKPTMLIAPLEVFEGNIRRLEAEIKVLGKRISDLEGKVVEHDKRHEQEEQEERWRDMGDDL